MNTHLAAHDELRRRVLDELDNDDVGLWSIVLRARNLRGVIDIETQTLVLDVIGGLLDDGLAVVGFPTSDGAGFVPWDTPPAASVARITKEWSDPGRAPDIGEIAWLARIGRLRSLPGPPS